MVEVKICGITTLADALASIEAGAKMLGFNFYTGSPRFISPSAARRIIDQLPEKVLSVGVFVNEDTPQKVAQIANRAGVRGIQLHGDESPEDCRELKDFFVIKALRLGEGFKPRDALQFETGGLLLDAFSREMWGGTGRTCDLALARRTCELIGSQSGSRVFLAGGLTVNNVKDAIETVNPYAVDVCSGIEIAPGVKDISRLRAFVAAARGCGEARP